MNKNIDCNVHNCKYCECNSNKCILNSIKISSCGMDNAKENTMCNNYKKRTVTKLNS